ncbi:MAG TPA: phage tail protein [Parafilimonas sp.]|jgi:phage tail-like protein|nr:phage tail protein [Parafilimonas sp.]
MPDFKYPLPKFHFELEWGGTRIGFTEVTGLDFETEVIEYREGNMPSYNKTKQPGLRKFTDITLKRGIVLDDFEYYTEWEKTAMFQEIKEKYRRTVTIKLLNEEHKAIIVWTLQKAWPSKVQSTDLKADGNEIAIETLTLVHEGLVMSKP